MSSLVGVKSELRGIALALVLVGAMTLALLALDRAVDLASHSVLYLIPVIASATRWGTLPAMAAAVGGVVASAFLFYPPIYSLQVLSFRDLIDLALFLTVAIVTSRLAMGLKRQTEIARMRAETDLLREALIGSVSHELRTPLASIMGAATVLKDAPPLAQDARLGALATVVRDEAERLNNEIQNLLDATRISSQGVRPRMEWAEPSDIVNSAVERRRHRLVGHPVRIDMDAELPLIYVDAVLVEQALVQILDNAAKYSPGGTEIAVTARRRGEHVVLSVEDRGLGFDREELARLGERFFRGARHAGTIAGTGLGLWIAAAFARVNGGDLQATSEGPGRGATVSIRLPVPREAAAMTGTRPDE